MPHFLLAQGVLHLIILLLFFHRLRAMLLLVQPVDTVTHIAPAMNATIECADNSCNG